MLRSSNSSRSRVCPEPHADRAARGESHPQQNVRDIFGSGRVPHRVKQYDFDALRRSQAIGFSSGQFRLAFDTIASCQREVQVGNSHPHGKTRTHMGKLAPTWENLQHIFAMAPSGHGSRKLIRLLENAVAMAVETAKAEARDCLQPAGSERSREVRAALGETPRGRASPAG